MILVSLDETHLLAGLTILQGQNVANIKGQIKRNRQNEKRRIKNRGVRSEINSRVKTAIANAEAGETNSDDAQIAIKKIDKAVSKKILHKNTAARKKSRLAKRLNSLDS